MIALLKGEVFVHPGSQITEIIHLETLHTNINKHHCLLGLNGISPQGILLLDAVIFTVLEVLILSEIGVCYNALAM